MNLKKCKLKIIASFIVLVTILAIQLSSYANNTKFSIELKDTSERYKNWEILSEEEKQNTIQPNILSTDLKNAVKRSTLNSLKASETDTLPEKYNLADTINMTIKNQEDTSQCWAFATTNLLETNMAKFNAGKYTVLSPRHMDYATSKTFLDGINSKGYNRELKDGGSYMISMGYITSGNGPIAETEMPFKNDENKVNLSEIEGKKVVQKVERYTTLPNIEKTYDASGNITYHNGESDNNKKEYTSDEVKSARNIIKQHIMKYGSLGAYTYGGENANKFYNSTFTAYYCNDSTIELDHAITIVGWDDNYSIDNFNTTNKPKNKGAYIVLQSYGANAFDKGYQYVSYDDIFIESGLTSVIQTSEVNYDNIYQYDELGMSNATTLNVNNVPATSLYAANVFNRKKAEANKKEYLNEVAIQLFSTNNVEIYANLESDDKSKMEKIASPGVLESGYHTIKLSTPIEIKGEKFVVAAKYTNQEGATFAVEMNYKSNGQESNYWDTATASEGQSYLTNDINEEWVDLVKGLGLKDSNLCIKALSTYEEIKNIPVESISLSKSTLEMTEGESTNLQVIFNPTDATNKNVKWLTEDANIVSIDTKGNMTAIKEGKTTITVISEDGEKTAKCEVTVKKKTSNADDIYQPDTDKTNTPTNGKDTTTANKIIPYAGNNMVIVLVILGVLGIGIYAFIKIRKYKDI